MPDQSRQSQAIGITGASGFIGTYLQRSLHMAGCQITGFVRSNAAAARLLPSTRQVHLDISSSRDWHQYFNTHHCDQLILCAGTVRGLVPLDFQSANLDAITAVVQALDVLKQPPAILLISSLAATAPELSAYAQSKAAGERALSATSLNWTIIRPPAVYGPGDRELLTLFRLIRAGILPCIGPVLQRLPLLHAADLARAVVAWSRHCQRCAGQSFNLHDGHNAGYSWEDLSREIHGAPPALRITVGRKLLLRIARLNQRLAEYRQIPPMLTEGKVSELRYTGWICDNAAFTERTGWRPRIDLAVGSNDWLAKAPHRSLNGYDQETS